ncbi:hypothetical protein K461DRAFT_105730 [Myriangium duriaei CBS 260.36]|uniref:Uncharacterized protein n=1 Tax=Myriangium duriaei CBS 260.36 TaxID=1168546 RepID=A0A9P4J5K5_9PEZI|nr:hypothetical protein K461DRAFT_105730 [Myriangium duriaei CBS 260.36]
MMVMIESRRPRVVAGLGVACRAGATLLPLLSPPASASLPPPSSLPSTSTTSLAASARLFLSTASALRCLLEIFPFVAHEPGINLPISTQPVNLNRPAGFLRAHLFDSIGTRRSCSLLSLRSASHL